MKKATKARMKEKKIIVRDNRIIIEVGTLGYPPYIVPYVVL